MSAKLTEKVGFLYSIQSPNKNVSSASLLPSHLIAGDVLIGEKVTGKGKERQKLADVAFGSILRRNLGDYLLILKHRMILSSRHVWGEKKSRWKEMGLI